MHGNLPRSIGRCLAPAVFALLLVACGDTGGAATPAQGGGAGGAGGSGAGAASTYAVSISRGQDTLAHLTLAAIEKLNFVEVSVDGSAQRGPRLRDLLALADVRSFDTVTITGQAQGRIGTAEVTLTAADVDAGAMFDVARRGTLKLVIPDRPRSQWVVDVQEIQVTP